MPGRGKDVGFFKSIERHDYIIRVVFKDGKYLHRECKNVTPNQAGGECAKLGQGFSTTDPETGEITYYTSTSIEKVIARKVKNEATERESQGQTPSTTDTRPTA